MNPPVYKIFHIFYNQRCGAWAAPLILGNLRFLMGKPTLVWYLVKAFFHLNKNNQLQVELRVALWNSLRTSDESIRYYFIQILCQFKPALSPRMNLIDFVDLSGSFDSSGTNATFVCSFLSEITVNSISCPSRPYIYIIYESPFFFPISPCPVPSTNFRLVRLFRDDLIFTTVARLLCFCWNAGFFSFRFCVMLKCQTVGKYGR